MKTKNRLVVRLASLFLPGSLLAAPATIEVHTAQPGPAFSPTRRGVFFEDINYAADGGLCAELIENRSFEHREMLFAWKEMSRAGTDGMQIASDWPVHPNNPEASRNPQAETALGGPAGHAKTANPPLFFSASELRVSFDLRISSFGFSYEPKLPR